MRKLILKYSSILLVTSGLVFLPSCDNNFEAINTNPNTVPVLTPSLMFSKALYDGAANSGNKGSLLFGLMQYTTSYNDVEGFGSKYVASQVNATGAVFNNSYPTQINEIEEVIKAVKVDPAKINMYAMARIWRVYCFSRLTDLYGDIPYSEAAQGYNLKNYQPKYDAQSAIYADMLKELDEAAAALDPAQTLTYGSSDLIYGGNVGKWKKFAYSLMLRLGMRLTKVEEATAQSWVTKAIAGGVIRDYADIAKMSYTASGQNINKNPIAWQLLNDNYIRANGVDNTEGGKYQKVFIDSLKANNDPRLGVLAVVYVNGVASSDESIQKGMPATINGTKPADFVTYSEPKQTTVLRVDAPLLLFTVAESDFLLAEAALRNWYTTETASDLYEAGIRAAMKQWDLISGIADVIDQGRINSYVTAHTLHSSASVEEQKEQIYNQFWLGLFPDAQEVYNNYRRTGYPALVPNVYPGNATGGQIFRRFLYPVSEQTLNRASYNDAVANQGADDLMTKIWWDKQ
ncbi:SusD/RagB family nutrient-binding outer membrane lipoprotein [Xanthocytophaga agilis]|uniref:SusD/RagB family nutrient-binding outer membrane lipoprotein n=1 Tax=Xanthocytophaga agilis TaxID=3048010 RepID=A0AAE3R195_9BACT|nr:SusD/RagB family nutrient-binding outer membrane lipoprotein [Xanthocytophaga agilis]MDJ1499819.1 SusD/RagB family nutrient-binding outer membrane lipoprotein [Xanthocytophaga agilis]